MSDSRFHRLTVAEVIAESDDACSFVFDVPAALRDAFVYRPGQFLTLNVPCAEAAVARCYSLSSAPGIDAAPKITVKRVRDGRASNWLCDRIRAGDALDVLAPAGVFTPRTLDGDLLLFAGGSGITPVLSILKSALVHGRGMLTLIYANRDERSVIFRDELQQLAQRHPGRLRVIHWLDSVQGIPQQRHLEELARPFSQQETFICGPALFMENALAAMLGLGLPRARVHVERFASLPDTPAPAQAGPAAATASGDGAAIETVLDGAAFALDSAPGETLLDAMLRAGLPAPNSCRMGQCGACMCRVERGEVALDGNHVLDDDEIAAGWTLACCARPASAALRVVFPD
ncbi:ferredoxin--NADP reductase [Burkholderia pseudomultivorans]|uniref:3-ketosteroid-9-alpha-monooxygenase, ferredoxin reductase component n=1 Tax=Burkholderia pseudomultivorans TaxID=1207504 RepID=A0ABU2E8F8_9BURK|nr:ferredoxin--NADP reductase [Burkholderia pseudomultivorans]MDR8726324.1 3-ketosteroid-9-alpha-monooxygenase, ferredoxin reductase component [Burkholderia pseudomultivorans]MDR8733548.1 3-ketosteroid-9-alpha-monooxygenase, ferredoxin reductase component [Burkholderia pseudomultivorans]MDR8740074.1 3-ketosteroid-9-alpha-monooxygenase, ferredoxin reductase component [Burkholderia pseudomultivorans]MDR8756163.1 3-ketosteroid-9-alpha-monooxygenase, ferredoxin reductase component [Burkholderia pse